jgi:ABC-type oligopeptide transport system substrate-binding subunit
MNTMKNKILALLVAFSLAMLNACGGGSDSSSPSNGNNQPVTKTFIVSLESVDIRRSSNGDVVDVNTAGISSGTLTLNQ